MPFEKTEKYWRIRIRPSENYLKFRTQDIGRRGHAKRIAGWNGKEWETQSFLIPREDAYEMFGSLVGRDAPTRGLISDIRRKHGVRI